MDLKWLLFSFKGRINRKPFWIFTVITSLIYVTINFATGNIVEPENNTQSLLLMSILLWPTLAVQAKRWHDRGKSAWWILITIVPVIGGIWALIENGFLKGIEGENQYGMDPLEDNEIQLPEASLNV